jgi:hypothetical protein
VEECVKRIAELVAGRLVMMEMSEYHTPVVEIDWVTPQ